MKNLVVLLFLLMFLHGIPANSLSPARAVTGAVVGDVYMDSTWKKTNILC